MRYKILLMLMSIFVFIPVFKADTYYDWEQVDVENLPEATESTMNKVYIQNDEFYVTEKINGDLRPLMIGDYLTNKTLYFSFPDNLSSCLYSNYNSSSYTKFPIVYIDNMSGFRSIYVDSNRSVRVEDNNVYHNMYGFVNKKSYIYVGQSCTNCDVVYAFTEEDKCNILDYIKISTEAIYKWKKVSKSDVVEIIVPDEDFYLFFTFEDISSFNILSNYDLTSFNDFQKIVTVLGFNSFFLGFIGFVIYIIIKLVNKGISLIFR